MNIRQNLRTRCARLAMLVALLFPAAGTAHAAAATELTLPPIFANEMILQRDQPVNVWGKSFAGDTITVTFGDATVRNSTTVSPTPINCKTSPTSPSSPG